MALCKDHDIECKNQSFNQFITQIKNQHFDTSIERYVFTKAERVSIYEAKPNCNSCKKKITKSTMQLSHIKALANRFNNDLLTIPVLCMRKQNKRKQTDMLILFQVNNLLIR